jgi:hypothetical protein
MNSIRYTKLLALVGLSALCGFATTSFAQSATNVSAVSPSTSTVRPTGTFRGGLDIIACSGPGCRGGILATFTNDGHVKLMWKSEAEAFAAMKAGKPWAQEKSMEGAGYGNVRTNANGTVSFDNGSYNHFDNCKFDGAALTRCYFSRADNSQAVAWITLTKVP